MFVSSADMNLLLLIAPELRLAPLHALHDTSRSTSDDRFLLTVMRMSSPALWEWLSELRMRMVQPRNLC